MRTANLALQPTVPRPDSAKAWIKSRGSKVKIRAPGQHARFIERQGAVLQDSLHITEQQCIKEDLEIAVQRLVAISVSAGNAFTTVGTSTPYQVVLGRQPAMLTPLEDPDFSQAGDSADGRVKARVREIAIFSMAQVSALSRVGRTLKSIPSYRFNRWQVQAK